MIAVASEVSLPRHADRDIVRDIMDLVSRPTVVTVRFVITLHPS